MLKLKATVVAPRWNGETYELAKLKSLSGSGLRRGPMNILEPAEAEIVKRHITEPYQIYRKLMGKGGSTSGEVNPIHGGKKSWKQRLSLYIRGNFFIPDPRVLWVRPSVRFLKKYLKDHPVEAIVTTGPPQSMHLIGLELSKATGLPWVADFRDPWTKMFYFKHLGLTPQSDARHHALEKSVLDGATRVIAVSPMVQE